MTLPNDWGRIDLPAGLVSTTATFTYSQLLTPTQGMEAFAFAGRYFSLVAIDEIGSSITGFSTTFTVTLEYQDSDWQNAGLRDESSLSLYYWDGSTWQDVLPCVGCSHDTENNTIVAVLNHLTGFAVLSPRYRIYLPVVVRGYVGGW